MKNLTRFDHNRSIQKHPRSDISMSRTRPDIPDFPYTDERPDDHGFTIKHVFFVWVFLSGALMATISEFKITHLPFVGIPLFLVLLWLGKMVRAL